jgi:nucleoside-diphosphate-sugar epimerase
MLSIFGGTGFIGSAYHKDRGGMIVNRDEVISPTSDILYFISTTHNYHVFDDPFIDINTNLIYLMKVLSSNKDKDIVFNFISSWFVYGDTDLPAKETSTCRPKGFYSITKKCAEDLIISYCQTFGIKYRILRLCNVYGHGDIASPKKNALQFLIGEIKKNKDIQLYYDGEFVRDYLHVKDVCSAINLVVESGDINSIYNIGSGIPLTFRTIIERAIIVTGSMSSISSMDAPDFHKLVQVKDMYLDTTKLEKLGFIQSISIEDGINLICSSQ